MVLMPGELRLRHVSTPADVLGILCSLDINIEPTTLQATEVGWQHTQQLTGPGLVTGCGGPRRGGVVHPLCSSRSVMLQLCCNRCTASDCGMLGGLPEPPQLFTGVSGIQQFVCAPANVCRHKDRPHISKTNRLQPDGRLLCAC
jgi:hypothetical protein